MNKKFEYVDDNPGSYFGMLVESLDNPVDVETIKSVIKGIKNNLGIDEYEIRRESKDSDTIRFRYDGKIYFAHPYSSNQVDIFDGNNNKLADKVFIDNIKETVFTESLKEDKFVSRDKMSKKDRKELDNQKRNTWGNTNPVTRVQPNKKAYDRKRDKKVVDEAKETFSSLSELADKIDKLSAVSMAYEDDGKIKIKGRWRKSTRQSNNDYVSINSSLKKLLGDKKYKLVFENIDSRDGGKEFSAQLSLTVPKVVVESLTEDSEVFKDMSNALDDITYLCNDTYNWDIDEWNDKKNVKNTAERIIDSANVLLDSIKKY